MQEFIFTLVVIYVLFRVFGKNVKVYHFNNYAPPANPRETSRKNEGRIKVDYIPPQKGDGKKDSDGEYVDYEEVKN